VPPRLRRAFLVSEPARKGAAITRRQGPHRPPPIVPFRDAGRRWSFERIAAVDGNGYLVFKGLHDERPPNHGRHRAAMREAHPAFEILRGWVPTSGDSMGSRGDYHAPTRPRAWHASDSRGAFALLEDPIRTFSGTAPDDRRGAGVIDKAVRHGGPAYRAGSAASDRSDACPCSPCDDRMARDRLLSGSWKRIQTSPDCFAQFALLRWPDPRFLPRLSP